MARSKNPGEIIQAGMEAHTNLNMFDVILQITENNIRGDRKAQKACDRIREICLSERRRLIDPIDDARALARKETP